jgi:hypothetical protein
LQFHAENFFSVPYDQRRRDTSSEAAVMSADGAHLRRPPMSAMRPLSGMNGRNSDIAESTRMTDAVEKVSAKELWN